MSAYLPDHPGSCTRLRKRKFTYSETVHPASRAFFVISPMLEALPEFYWINLLLTSICLSVSLTSVWQKTSSKTEKLKIRWILGMHLHPKPSPSSCIHSGNRSFHLPSPLCLQPVPWLAPRAFPVRRSPAMDFCCNVPSTSNYSPINLRQNGQKSRLSFPCWLAEPCSGRRDCGVHRARELAHWRTSLNISGRYSVGMLRSGFLPPIPSTDFLSWRSADTNADSDASSLCNWYVSSLITINFFSDKVIL